MKTISVRYGHVAIVDDEDYEKCLKYDWIEYGGGYAYRTGPGYMHHFVFGKPSNGLLTDHINRNKMDNRKINLRFTTYTINFINRPSIYSEELRNIHLRGDKYLVQITRYKKAHCVGYFDDLKEAQIARDTYLIEHFPETVLWPQ